MIKLRTENLPEFDYSRIEEMRDLADHAIEHIERNVLKYFQDNFPESEATIEYIGKILPGMFRNAEMMFRYMELQQHKIEWFEAYVRELKGDKSITPNTPQIND